MQETESNLTFGSAYCLLGGLFSLLFAVGLHYFYLWEMPQKAPPQTVVIFFSCVGLGLIFLGLAAVGRQIIHRIRLS